jgi:hypothetical protein
MEIINISDLNGQTVYHVGFIPYTVDDNSNVSCLLAYKGNKVSILGGGCKSSKKEPALDCLKRELSEELNMSINLIPSRVTIMLLNEDNDNNPKNTYSVIVWYQVDDFNSFLSKNRQGYNISEEITKLDVFSWSWLQQQDHLRLYDGKPQWFTTTVSRIQIFRNLCFFNDVCSLTKVLTYGNHHNLQRFTTIYPEVLFDSLSYDEFTYVNPKQIFVVPYNKGNIWLSSNRRGEKNFIDVHHPSNNSMTATKLTPSVVIKNFLPNLSSSSPLKADNNNVVTYMLYPYRSEPVGIIWISVSDPYKRSNTVKYALSSLVVGANNKMGTDTYKIIRKLNDVCGSWNVSPVSRKRYDSSFFGDTSFNDMDSGCTVNNIFMAQTIIDRFRYDHNRVIDSILHFEQPIVEPDYIDNDFGLDVVNLYLERNHPLIVIYDQFSEHRDTVSIDNVVANIIDWCAVTDFYIDVDLYYAIRDRLATIADRNGDRDRDRDQLSDKTVTYFDYIPY